MEEQKVLLLLENIQAMVKANLDGQKAFAEALERRWSALEKGVDCLKEKMQWAANAGAENTAQHQKMEGRLNVLAGAFGRQHVEIEMLKANAGW